MSVLSKLEAEVAKVEAVVKSDVIKAEGEARAAVAKLEAEVAPALRQALEAAKAEETLVADEVRTKAAAMAADGKSTVADVVAALESVLKSHGL